MLADLFARIAGDAVERMGGQGMGHLVVITPSFVADCLETIEEIRGVSVSRGTLDQLIALDWIRFGRRRDTPGRPVTFVVTEGFLDHFGLQSARDLPGLRDLKEAGLLEARPSPETEADGDDDRGGETLFDQDEGDDADDGAASR